LVEGFAKGCAGAGAALDHQLDDECLPIVSATGPEHHNAVLGTVHDGEELGPFGLGYVKLVKGLLQVIEKRLPFLLGNVPSRNGRRFSMT
jgi:hypothetical protein